MTAAARLSWELPVSVVAAGCGRSDGGWNLARLRQNLNITRINLADMRLRLVTLNDHQQQLTDIPKALRNLREAGKAGADDEQSDVGAVEQLPPLLRARLELLAYLSLS